MKKLGLDLGSSSIGWALREDNKIEKYGVITFQSGMQKGQGGYSSPTKDRREARSKRRLIQVRKYRKWALLKTLIDEFVPLNQAELEIWSKYQKGEIQKFPENESFLKWLACDFTYLGNDVKYKNPYELRISAIDNVLHKHEFGRALYHIIQRRGYKNIGETDEETEKQIKRRDQSGFQSALDNSRTIAEVLKKEFLDNGIRARNQYPYREEYESELELICKGQNYDISKNEKGEYNNNFVQLLWKAIIWQRPLRSQKGNIGKCTLEPTKPRCPISHPVFEVFRSWSFINTIKYLDKDGVRQNVPLEFKKLLFEQLFLKKDKNFKFEDIRKFLDKQFQEQKKYNYPFDEKKKIYDTSIAGMPVCCGLIKIFGKEVESAIFDIEKYNIGNAPKIIKSYSIYDLWHILFEFDEKYLGEFAVKKLKVANEENKKGIKNNPFQKLKHSIETGYSDLSLKAMAKIIPFLKEEYLYSEAVLLSKIPELLGSEWDKSKEIIKKITQDSNKDYTHEKTIVGIVNNLIDQYKGLEYPNVYAAYDFEYNLKNNHDDEIEKACKGYFGEKSWEIRIDKEETFNLIKDHYQKFIIDPRRAYRPTPTLSEIFKRKLNENKIHIHGTLYHHSKKENIYGVTIKDRKTGIEILPEARIDSIKNPMFNKSLSVLRKLINQFILNGIIDNDTEVVIELARELNDNNKRAAIEQYQNERKNNRDKYREFLKEYLGGENTNIDVEDKIPAFELWSEQIFEDAINEKGIVIKNKNRIEILKEKEAIKRYELWMEQKGQCMYTGRMISIAQLFSNEIDIEHTIPRSILPDNTMANQTVAFAKYNRDIKDNRLPTQCENYTQEKVGVGTSILPRLDKWIDIRDGYKDKYEKRLKPSGNEDENKKNTRIKEKHYLKMHLDYWNDKIERFLAKEVKDSWARRQLVDTQMISKYAKEYLKTYFKKVAVQKGIVTADFRKIYGFQESDEIKVRNKHTHHAIDAAVLTLISTNSSHRESVLKKMYEMSENKCGQYTSMPFSGFNSQALINDIDNNTLIVNYKKDVLLRQTSKKVRKRGRIQYVKNKKGEFVLDGNGKKIGKIAAGDTVRSSLFKQTFLGKIKDVERHEDGQPKREAGDWKYKTGKEEFIFTERVPSQDVISKNYINYIIDPIIRKLFFEQRNKGVIKDYQGNIIRHVRIKTNAGKEVKERVNYRSKHPYKNYYYSSAGSVPYAIVLQKNIDGEMNREMIPIASYEIARITNQKGGFNLDDYINDHHSEFKEHNKKLLSVGQKVIVLKEDNEFEHRDDSDFKSNRLYVIMQFSDGSIWLKYHLIAQSKKEIDQSVKIEKDIVLSRIEKKYNIPEIIEDNSIENTKARKDDYDKRKYSFDQLSRFRFQKLLSKIELEEVKKIKDELDKLKTQSAIIEVEGKTPLLKMSSENWNFLYEGTDFKITMDGSLQWLDDLK